MAKVLKSVNDEDWKTAIAQNKKNIPQGAEVEVLEKIQNLYGEFVRVKYNGVNYNLKSKDIEY